MYSLYFNRGSTYHFILNYEMNLGDNPYQVTLLLIILCYTCNKGQDTIIWFNSGLPVPPEVEG